MMRDWQAIAWRECAALFLTPTAWGALAIFAFATGVITGIAVLVPGAPAELRTVAAAAGWAMLLIAPVLSLRPTTEERRSGFWEVLATSPAGVGALVCGRYTAGMLALTAICIVGLGAPYAVLESLSRPDLGESLCAVGGVLLVGSMYLASGLFFGSISSSASLAYLATFFFWLLVLIAIRSIAPVLSNSNADMLFAVDPVRRLEGFINGELDSSNGVYFICMTAGFLAAAAVVQSMEAERGGNRGAFATRLRVALSVSGVIALVLSIAALAHAPIARISIDATKSRAWTLDDQTRRLVGALPQGWQMTWIAPSGGMDNAIAAQFDEVRMSVMSVMPVMPVTAITAAHASNQPAHERIDPTTPDGAVRYAAWLNDLVGRRRGSAADMLEAVRLGVVEMEALAAYAAAESARLTVVIDQLPADSKDRQPIEQVRGAMRGLASGTPAIVQTIQAMQIGRPDRAIVDYSQTAAVVATHNRDWAAQFGAFSNWLLQRSLDQHAPAALGEFARLQRPELGVRARALLRSVDALDALPSDPLEELSIGLARGGGLVVESPNGIVFVPDSALAVNAVDQGSIVRFDRRYRMEQLIAGAIRSILDLRKPELIIVHAQERSMLTSAADGFDCTAISDACRAARIAVREWNVTAEPQPIADERAVWMIIPPRTVAVERDAIERALLEAINGLVTQGRPLFFSIGPSLRPLAGRSDPWSEIAATLGARALSDAVIVDDIPVAEGQTERRTKVDIAVLKSENPLAHALADQRLGFAVAIPIDSVPVGNNIISSQALLAARPEPNRSIERDWRRSTPDARSTKPTTEAIPVAVVTTRRLPGMEPIRAMITGSPSWMVSSVVDSARSLGAGRDALLNPGNREFAVNGVLWLAGLDQRLGNTGSGREAPRIGPMTIRKRLELTAGLALGVPFASLMIGVLISAWRSRR